MQYFENSLKQYTKVMKKTNINKLSKVIFVEADVS